ncbi:hypothetical protein LIA77_01730 [Sarocladium implicatum]|nr:hypothetical protein LIA77_01730 [Sarocladium implicatum]
MRLDDMSVLAPLPVLTGYQAQLGQIVIMAVGQCALNGHHPVSVAGTQQLRRAELLILIRS